MRAAVAFHHDAFSQTHTRQGKTGRQKQTCFLETEETPQNECSLRTGQTACSLWDSLPLDKCEHRMAGHKNPTLPSLEGEKKKTPTQMLATGRDNYQKTSWGHNVNRISRRLDKARTTPGNQKNRLRWAVLLETTISRAVVTRGHKCDLLSNQYATAKIFFFNWVTCDLVPNQAAISKENHYTWKGNMRTAEGGTRFRFYASSNNFYASNFVFVYINEHY